MPYNKFALRAASQMAADIYMVIPRVALARNGALADPGLIAFTLAGFSFSGYRRAWCRR